MPPTVFCLQCCFLSCNGLLFYKSLFCTVNRTQLALRELPLWIFKAFNSQLLLPNSTFPHITTIGCRPHNSGRGELEDYMLHGLGVFSHFLGLWSLFKKHWVASKLDQAVFSVADILRGLHLNLTVIEILTDRRSDTSTCGALSLCSAPPCSLSLASAGMIIDAWSDAAIQPIPPTLRRAMLQRFVSPGTHILLSGVPPVLLSESGTPVCMLDRCVELQRRKQAFDRELMKAFHPHSLMRDCRVYVNRQQRGIQHA